MSDWKGMKSKGRCLPIDGKYLTMDVEASSDLAKTERDYSVGVWVFVLLLLAAGGIYYSFQGG